MTNQKFDFNDISLIPAIQSDIVSRKLVNTKYSLDNEEHYPLIVSPMDTVIDENNYIQFLEQGMIVCIPRGTEIKNFDSKYSNRTFFSYSLNEFSELFSQKNGVFKQPKLPECVLIDLANGHISSIPELIKKFKLLYPTKKIMVGNIANPETYRVLSMAGADYIRCGIGGGSACLTSEKTAIHYPMASLIKECSDIQRDLKIQSKNAAKIVGDGGFREYSDIIKGLALGSDYIMIGSSLNKCLESAGSSYFKGIKISNNISKFLYNKGFRVFKKFRGMSTKEVQRKWNKTELRASEGIVTTQEVKYTLSGWIRNFDDYLKSSMSYSNSKQLSDFISKARYVFITQNAFNRFNK